MTESSRILFYENGDPLDPRCIERFIWAFPRSYRQIVKSIIGKSERLDKEIFRWNVASLMAYFGMARSGAFHGVRVNRNDAVIDRTGVIDLCWRQIGNELQKLKENIKEEVRDRNRALVTLSPSSERHVIKEISRLFGKLRKVNVSPVGASKVLFATIPEIALPVDRAEWRYVFKTTEYGDILFKMASEIKEWERESEKRLETLDSSYPKATLPGFYNVMAISVRDMLRIAKR